MMPTRFSLLLFVLPVLWSSFGSAQTFSPGNVYFDSTGYVEYRAGNLPVILSAPHGGGLEPADIPDRDCAGCVSIRDAWTQPITEGIYDAFVEKTGCYPHVIINLLHRKKFDANRGLQEAADGNPTVEQAWYGYHAFIDSAKAQVERDYGRGLFLDMHGHGHTIQRIELGYLLSRSELQMPDGLLNTNTYIQESSIRTLAADNHSGLSHAALLRGNSSFGTIMDMKGLPSVPSSTDPYPDNGEDYFSGGYNTARHGSRDNAGQIDAIQIEMNQDIRFTALAREITIDSTTQAIIEFIRHHYFEDFGENYCNLVSSSKEGFSIVPEIYPNPAMSFFEIRGIPAGFEIELYNQVGQRLLTTVSAEGKVNIEDLPRGLYLVIVKSSGQILGIQKLTKL
jgi:hypothetical protein